MTANVPNKEISCQIWKVLWNSDCGVFCCFCDGFNCWGYGPKHRSCNGCGTISHDSFHRVWRLLCQCSQHPNHLPLDSSCFIDQMVNHLTPNYYTVIDDLGYTYIIISLNLPSSLSRAFQGLCINEFSGLKFDHQNSFDVQTGEQVTASLYQTPSLSPSLRSSEVKRFWHILQALERLSFEGSRIRETIAAQSRILMFWYCTTYLLLEKNKPKYQKLMLLLDNGDAENPGVQQLEPPLDEAEVDQTEEPEDDLKQPPVEDQSQTSSDELDEILPFVLEGL